MKPTLSCIIGMRKDILFSRNFQHSIHLLHTAKQQAKTKKKKQNKTIKFVIIYTLSLNINLWRQTPKPCKAT